MLKRLNICVLLIAGGGAGIGMVTAGTNTLELTAELVDSTRLIGRPAIEEFRLQSALGELTMPLQLVRGITFDSANNTASATMTNGDRLSGVAMTVSIPLDTLIGRVELPCRHLSHVSVRSRQRGALPEGGN